jgi:Flp pilus assembly pilin Flp
MINFQRVRAGQSTMEYAVLVAIVAAALVAMHTYVRRAMQANLKNLELELNAAR